MTAATALQAADRFTWDGLKLDRPTETLSQVHLTEGERVALNAAISASLGAPMPNLSADEQAVDVRVKLIDLNGDHIPEVIVHLTGTFWCGATGNCPFRIFRKSGKTYQSLSVEDFGESQGFTVMQHRSGGYLDLIFNRHESAYQQSLLVFKFRDGQYRASDCYEATWESIDDEGAIAKEPTITPCRRPR
jgi:hypothetical protein